MSDFLAAQRAGWEKAVSMKDRPYVVERPPVFSPAAAAQARGNLAGSLFLWTPMYLPLEYTHWSEECVSYVRTAYIGDWSALNKLSISGPQALEFLSWAGMNKLSPFEIGQVKHHVQLDENGKVASEGILYRVAEQEFLYTGGGADWTAHVFSQRSWDAKVALCSADYFIFEVQGPKSLQILERVAGENLRDVRFNFSRPVSIGADEVLLLRTGITGELGYELHGPAEAANRVWSAVVEQGAPLGLCQIGMRSQIISHVEAGIATNGLDYLPSSIITPGAPKLMPGGMPSGSFIPYHGVGDFFRSPGELGWGGRGPLNAHEFLGKPALVAEAVQGGSPRRLVGLVWNEDDVNEVSASLFGDGPQYKQMELPRALSVVYDEVLFEGARVGCATSRVYSSHLRRMISFAVIDRALAAAGREVIVVWGDPGTEQKRIRATVTTLPFKEDRRRCDVTGIPE